MSKELEALNELFNLVTCQDSFEKGQKCYDIIEEALQRLEAIDNAKPSETLEDLKELHELAYGNEETSWKIDEIRMSSHIKQALLKSQEQEKEIDRLENQCLDLISDNIRLKNKAQEQEKVLEIIFEKNVNIGLVKVLGSVGQYNQTYVYDNMRNVKWCLTQEEFDLLKRYCEIL